MLTRIIDILISLIGIIFLFIILPVVAFLIKIDSTGPVFFNCDRVGKDRKIFKMYKFRTMYETKSFLGTSISPQGDPRVTPVGRILRRLKLNEFPQFLNILKGDMTLIGPRPEAPDLAADYPPEANNIFLVKPGLLGPNQIHGRNEEELYPRGVDPKQYYLDKILPKKLVLDLHYIQEKSFLVDIKYLFGGIWVTIKGAIQGRHLLNSLSQILMLLSDTICCLLAFTLAHLIRFDGFPPGSMREAFLAILPFTPVTIIAFLFYFGCYQTLFPYLGLKELKIVFLAVILGTGSLIISAFLLGLATNYSRGVFVIYWLLVNVMLIGYRVLGKSWISYYKQKRTNKLNRRRTLIFGANEEGLLCLLYLRKSQNPSYEIIGFLDEDPKLLHRRIDGCKVLGDHNDLEILAKLYKVQDVFVVTSLNKMEFFERIQDLCNELSITLSCFVPRQINKNGDFQSDESVGSSAYMQA